MALLGKFDEGYTRTGNNAFTSFANWANIAISPIAAIPILGWIPGALVGGIAWISGMLGTAVESVGWLLKGKPLSAATAAVAGTVSNTINSGKNLPVIGTLSWWVNPLSVGLTGRSVGTHARKGVEEVVGGIGRMVGMTPTVVAHPVGIGYLNSSMMQSGPGQFASMEAQRRGQDPQAYYQSKMNGEMAQHVAELDSARSQPGYQGLA